MLFIMFIIIKQFMRIFVSQTLKKIKNQLLCSLQKSCKFLVVDLKSLSAVSEKHHFRTKYRCGPDEK